MFLYVRDIFAEQPAPIEQARLYAEHAALVDRHFATGLTELEYFRLDTIRKQLHAIQAMRDNHDSD